MSLKPLMILAALAGMAATPAAAQERPNEARDLARGMGIGGLSGSELEQAISASQAHPLGSLNNPVRENMPEGQRAYLTRLRCPGGQAPAFARTGTLGTGVYGNTVDRFEVTCPGAAAVEVYMDMYHDGPENRPVPSFTIVAAPGAASS